MVSTKCRATKLNDNDSDEASLFEKVIRIINLIIKKLFFIFWP